MIIRLLRLSFHLLYHQFAWTYDGVAAIVSLGQWTSWGRSVLPYLVGQRILELGHGPGHLQCSLHEKGFWAIGVDESRQMSRQAARRLRRSGAKGNLLRGLAQQLPLASASFDCVVSTFPSEYIFHSSTLSEIHRTLVPNGRLVILLGAWPRKLYLLKSVLNWIDRSFGQSQQSIAIFQKRILEGLGTAGFDPSVEFIESPKHAVYMILADAN
ncbi:MAG: class I SAM-dependent methyltransferase [Chloroflexota bacterium]